MESARERLRRHLGVGVTPATSNGLGGGGSLYEDVTERLLRRTQHRTTTTMASSSDATYSLSSFARGKWVVGGVVIAAGVAGGLYLLYRRWKQKQRERKRLLRMEENAEGIVQVGPRVDWTHLYRSSPGHRDRDGLEVPVASARVSSNTKDENLVVESSCIQYRDRQTVGQERTSATGVDSDDVADTSLSISPNRLSLLETCPTFTCKAVVGSEIVDFDLGSVSADWILFIFFPRLLGLEESKNPLRIFDDRLREAFSHLGTAVLFLFSENPYALLHAERVASASNISACPPLLADTNHSIARSLNLNSFDTNTPLPAVVLLDRNRSIRYVSICEPSLPLPNFEYLRRMTAVYVADEERFHT